MESKFEVVKFWADWCGPCKRMATIFDEVAKMDEFKDVQFSSIDVEERQEWVSELGIQSIPAIVLFKDGVEAGRILGLKPKKEIADVVRRIFN